MTKQSWDHDVKQFLVVYVNNVSLLFINRNMIQNVQKCYINGLHPRVEQSENISQYLTIGNIMEISSSYSDTRTAERLQLSVFRFKMLLLIWLNISTFSIGNIQHSHTHTTSIIIINLLAADSSSSSPKVVVVVCCCSDQVRKMLPNCYLTAT